MFEYYNKDTVTEIGGTMRIIGKRDSQLCLLKDRDGPIYVGRFYDCEYVAAFINEAYAGRMLSLYLDRRFLPCDKKDAVRSIEPNFGNYSISVLYRKMPSIAYGVVAAIREVLYKYSPYDIIRYDKNGEVTGDRYNKMVITDRRKRYSVCIAFTHGIHIIHEGLEENALRAVGGVQAKEVAKWTQHQTSFIYNSQVGDLRWVWDHVGKPDKRFAYGDDPDLVLGGVRHHGDLLEFIEPASTLVEEIRSQAKGDVVKLEAALKQYKESMTATYAMGGIDKQAEIDEFFSNVREYLLQ